MMHWKTFIWLVLFLPAAAPAALAQSPEQYFHSGARLYVEGRLGYAMEDVEAGLRLDPQNPKLTSLREKIREAMERQQRQQQQEEPHHEGEPDDQTAQDSEDQSPETGDQQGDHAEEQPPQPGADGAADDARPPHEGEPHEADPRPADPIDDAGRAGMTPEQAEQLLQAVEQDERELIREAQRNRTRPRHAYPDW